VPGWGARIPDCVAGGIRFTVPEPSERQHFENQIDAASVLARADFVNALRASHRDHSYHFVGCRVESKNGDAIGGGGDESDEALA